VRWPVVVDARMLAASATWSFGAETSPQALPAENSSEFGRIPLSDNGIRRYDSSSLWCLALKKYLQPA